MITKAVLALKSQDRDISFLDSAFSNQIFVHVCLIFKWQSKIQVCVGENVEWKEIEGLQVYDSFNHLRG